MPRTAPGFCIQSCLRVLLPAFCLLLFSACIEREDGGKDSAPAGNPSAAGEAKPSNGGSEPQQLDGSSGAMPAPTGDVKQVILIYSGDTISAMESQTIDDPPRGGLSALAGTIADYQREILRFTAKRVENEGGDAGDVRADFASGMLGPHPYMLLDYGGFERPNDENGSIFVQLYFNFFKDFAYTAIGGMRYQELRAETWREYKALENQPTLLVSAGQPLKGVNTADLLPTVKVVTRQCHGQLWGIACLPIPAPGEVTPQSPSTAPLEDDFTAASNALAASGCEIRVLMAAGYPAKFFTDMAGQLDFDIVIGGPIGYAIPEGSGDLPQGGPLVLPVLEKAGRQLGICHLIYSSAGRAPTQYNFILRPVIDTGSELQPYYRQVYAAKLAHKAASKTGKGGN